MVHLSRRCSENHSCVGLLLRNIDHIVIRVAINQLVQGIDARPRRPLIHDNLEGLGGLRERCFLEVERLLFVLIDVEDSDLGELK
jgi:hypothetical protein